MTQKNPHSANSPIWMKPGQITYSAAVEAEAFWFRDCAAAVAANGAAGGTLPAGCNVQVYASGNRCIQPPVSGTSNGATQSPQSYGDVTDTIQTISGVCASGDCPVGFCYWTSLHGPFWQTTTGDVSIAGPTRRGTGLVIQSSGGQWQVRNYGNRTGQTSTTPGFVGGGRWECTRFNEIQAIPNDGACGSTLKIASDPQGDMPTKSISVVDSSGPAVTVLSGFIGNVSQANYFVPPQGGGNTLTPDFLKVSTSASTMSWRKKVPVPASPPFFVGGSQAQAWSNGCLNTWTPSYYAQNVQSTSDIQVVPAATASTVRCFIASIEGAWSRTRNLGSLQPFAEIYTGSGGEIRLRVSPTAAMQGGNAMTTNDDRVSATATCLKLR